MTKKMDMALLFSKKVEDLTDAELAAVAIERANTQQRVFLNHYDSELLREAAARLITRE